VGEIDDEYPRAALCQKGELHYVVVTVNIEKGYQRTADLYKFARRVEELDVDMAYTLDGGQTAVIAMNDKLINNVMKGHQRNISDIFYFATAVPDGE
jgi:exopolysaccharide biosynthesis protein